MKPITFLIFLCLAAAAAAQPVPAPKSSHEGRNISASSSSGFVDFEDSIAVTFKYKSDDPAFNPTSFVWFFTDSTFVQKCEHDGTEAPTCAKAGTRQITGASVTYSFPRTGPFVVRLVMIDPKIGRQRNDTVHVLIRTPIVFEKAQ